jgi:hypothetical protein
MRRAFDAETQFECGPGTFRLDACRSGKSRVRGDLVTIEDLHRGAAAAGPLT